MNEQISIITKDEIRKLPKPVQCTINRTYNNNHADITTTEYGTFKYIQCIGTPTQNTTGLLIFLNNNYNEPIVISDYTQIIENILERITVLESKED